MNSDEYELNWVLETPRNNKIEFRGENLQTPVAPLGRMSV